MPQTRLRLDGVVVESVHVDVDRIRTIGVLTAAEWVGVCPGCTARSTRPKGWVSTRPRDAKIGPDIPRIVWRKRKWLCTIMSCERKSFTESTLQVPPRAPMTVRAKGEMALAVLDDDRSVTAVSAAYRCSWNTCHDAMIHSADPVLAVEPAPVTVLGIDETRRGKAKWENCSTSGARHPILAIQGWAQAHDQNCAPSSPPRTSSRTSTPEYRKSFCSRMTSPK